MFAVCLLLAGAVREVTPLFLRASALSGNNALTVSVRSGARAMRVQNLTSESWDGCVVTIEGGVSSMPFAIPPNGMTRLGYQTFRAGTSPLGDRADGFSRAFHMTTMMCRNGGGQWQSATFR